MKVYVVERGEKHEGGYVQGVYLSEDQAVEEALKIDPCFDGGWIMVRNNYWENGCEYLAISEFEVETKGVFMKHLVPSHIIEWIMENWTVGHYQPSKSPELYYALHCLFHQFKSELPDDVRQTIEDLLKRASGESK